MSGCPGCPVVSGPCPVRVRFVSGGCPIACPVMSDMMSDMCPECPVGVRQCPIGFGQYHVWVCPKCPVWCPVVSVVSGHVRSCPVVSNCVQLCPTVSIYVHFCRAPIKRGQIAHLRRWSRARTPPPPSTTPSTSSTSPTLKKS